MALRPAEFPEEEWNAKWLPKAITAHGWLLFEDSKMSKSKGNIVRTETILDGFGEHIYAKEYPESTKHDRDLFAGDVLRYFLLREIPFGQDGSFSFDAMIARYNADLANGYGNLVSRTLKLIEQNCNSVIPAHEPFKKFEIHIADRIPRSGAANKLSEMVKVQVEGPPLAGDAVAAIMIYEDAFESLRFASPLDPDLAKGSKAGVLNSAIFLMTQTDGFLTATAPWKMAKLDTPEAKRQVADILYTAAEIYPHHYRSPLPLHPLRHGQRLASARLGRHRRSREERQT